MRKRLKSYRKSAVVCFTHFRRPLSCSAVSQLVNSQDLRPGEMRARGTQIIAFLKDNVAKEQNKLRTAAPKIAIG